MPILLVLALLQAAPAPPPPALPERVQVYVEALRAADAALAAGDAAGARERFELALERSPRNPTAAYGLACAAARAGASDDALDWLERAVEWGWWDPFVAEWDPDLEALRYSDRLAELVGRMLQRLEPLLTADGLAPSWRALIGEGIQGGAEVVALTPDGARVVAGLRDGRLLLLDGATGALERELGTLDARPWALAVSPDGAQLAALGHDGRLAFLGLGRGAASDSVQATSPSELSHPFGIHLAWSPDGERLLIVASRGEAGLWSPSGEPPARWRLGGSNCERRALWLPAGKRLVTAEGGTVQLRDGRTGEVLAEPVTCPAQVVGLAVSPDGRQLATGLADAWVLLWDLGSGVELGRRQFVDPVFPGDDDIPELAFSPDGRRLAWTSREGSHVEVVDPTTMELSWRSDFLGAHFFEAMRVVWSPGEPRVWYAFECGGGSLATAVPGPDAAQLELGMGSVPVFAGDRGALTLSGGVAVVDGGTGDLLWRRVEVPGGALVQAPSGHFTGTWSSLEGLRVAQPLQKDPPVLDARRVELLFDPKRVRAAQAGVPVAPSKL